MIFFMIKNFLNKLTEDLYHGINSRYSRRLPKMLHPKAQRLLDQLNAITRIDTLRIPPSNNLEKLKGDLGGFWSIRINEQWRVIFRCEDNNACDVYIDDYY